MNARHLAAAAAVLFALQGPTGAQSQPALNGYAVLGTESVRVGRGARVQPSAVGAVTGDVRLAPP